MQAVYIFFLASSTKTLKILTRSQVVSCRMSISIPWQSSRQQLISLLAERRFMTSSSLNVWDISLSTLIHLTTKYSPIIFNQHFFLYTNAILILSWCLIEPCCWRRIREKFEESSYNCELSKLKALKMVYIWMEHTRLIWIWKTILFLFHFLGHVN